jgi:hypothetical protein
MKTVVTMAVLAAMAVFGLRVLVATGAWQECGMPGDAAFIRAIIDFGARPGAAGSNSSSTIDHDTTADPDGARSVGAGWSRVRGRRALRGGCRQAKDRRHETADGARGGNVAALPRVHEARGHLGPHRLTERR